MELEFKNATLQKLLVFARKHLLKYWIFKIAADLLLRLIQWALRLMNHSYIKLYLVSVSKFSQKNRTVELYKAEPQLVRVPLFFGKQKLKPRMHSDLKYFSRDSYALEVKDVSVIANTDFLVKESTLIHDDSFSPYRHVSTIDRFGLGKFARTGISAKISLPSITRSYEKAINLSSGSSGNFSHFLMEVIPKMLYLDKNKLFLDYPILFDEDIGERLIRVLNYFNFNSRKLIGLKRFEQVKVKNLIQITSPTYAPLDIKRNYHNWGNDTVFSSHAAQLIHQAAGVSSQKATRKLYLNRSDSFIEGFQSNAARHVINQEEIISLLEKHEFEIIDLAKFNFNEQIKLFSSAKIIVSPIGAALTNAIFTQPSTKIIALASYYDGCDFTYHSRMMSAFERDFSIVLGNIQHRVGVPKAQNPYSIDPKDLAEAIDFAGANN